MEKQKEILNKVLKNNFKSALDYCFSRTKDLDDAKDLFQDAWTELLEILITGREINNYENYLYKLIDNKFKKNKRKYKPEIVDDEFLEKVEQSYNNILNDIYENDLLKKIISLVEKLDREVSSCFIKRVIIGKTYKEIARSMNCSEELARKRVSRATKYVKEELEKRK